MTVMKPDVWYDTSFLRLDGKKDFRMKKQYGNWHNVFDRTDLYLGRAHIDRYNATDFPVDTFRHLMQYLKELLASRQ